MDVKSFETWQGILLVVLSSGLVGALASSGIQWIKEARAKATDRLGAAEVEAIFLIRDLDALAVSCANSIWEHNEVFDQVCGRSEERSYPGAQKPDFIVDRQALAKIDKNISAKIAWLENEIRLGNEHIRSAWFHDALDWYQANDQQANLVGYYGAKAMEIATELRAKYSLRDNHYKWGMTGVSEVLNTYSLQSQEYLTQKD